MLVEPFAALLDRAADGTTPVRVRLARLAAFSGAADDVFLSALDPEPEHFHELVSRHADIARRSVLPFMSAHGLTVVKWSELDKSERARLAGVFARRVHPALTPLAWVDPTHPFPQPSSLSLNLAVTVDDRGRGQAAFVAVQIPTGLPRLLRVAGGVLPLEELVSAQLDRLLPGVDVASVDIFRVTREHGRGLTPATRLEIGSPMDDRAVMLLMREVGANDSVTYRLPDPLFVGTALATLVSLLPTRRARRRRSWTSANPAVATLPAAEAHDHPPKVSRSA